MEIRLDDKDNVGPLSGPDSYLQHLSEKDKIKENMDYPQKNVLDNNRSHYEYVGSSDTYYPLCKSKSTIFDSNAGQIICSICGMVIHDYIESVEPE